MAKIEKEKGIRTPWTPETSIFQEVNDKLLKCRLAAVIQKLFKNVADLKHFYRLSDKFARKFTTNHFILALRYEQYFIYNCACYNYNVLFLDGQKAYFRIRRQINQKKRSCKSLASQFNRYNY